MVLQPQNPGQPELRLARGYGSRDGRLEVCAGRGMDVSRCASVASKSSDRHGGEEDVEHEGDEHGD